MQCFLPHNFLSFLQQSWEQSSHGASASKKLVASWCDSLASHFPASDTSWLKNQFLIFIESLEKSPEELSGMRKTKKIKGEGEWELSALQYPSGQRSRAGCTSSLNSKTRSSERSPMTVLVQLSWLLSCCAFSMKNTKLCKVVSLPIRLKPHGRAFLNPPDHDGIFHHHPIAPNLFPSSLTL